jgi:uncharacterized phage protein (TIGR01671 family)
MYYDVFFDNLEVYIREEDIVIIGDRNEKGMLQHCILMQYTGLKDDNNKEIYEGDILNYSIDGHRQSDSYVVKDMVSWLEEMYDEDTYYRWDSVGKVIGNIYENPDKREDI